MASDMKLASEYLRVPKLSADGKGFVIWKERLELSIKAQGLYGHLDGTTVRPNDPPTRSETSVLTQEEVSMNDEYARNIATYLQQQAIVFQQIASTIPDSLYLKIKGKPTIKEAWDALKADFEKRSRMITIELRKKLHDIRCAENGNVRAHFDTIRTMREELASLGTTINQQDFSAIILGSLPKNYDQFLSAVTATASVLKQDLDPEDLMQTIIDEFNRCSTRSGFSKDKNADAAFFAGGTGYKGAQRSTKDLECYNCHKKGHKKSDCWAKGGGKEGQGPRSKDRRGKGIDTRNGNKVADKESANVADSEDGVWVAAIEDSGDEGMADTEFDDFIDTMDDSEEEEGEENEVLNLIDRLKKLFRITTVPSPYNVSNDLKDILDLVDTSSDDDQGAAMQVMSESDDDEVEIDP